ncbi:MAG: bifunctional aspartate kinase/homoserine dehydrogenase I [Putridiphycobacter sp.]
MKTIILKFGGKSLANGKGIEQVLSIIQNKLKEPQKLVVVLSARGQTTNTLENLIYLAKEGQNFKTKFKKFKAYQEEPLKKANLKTELNTIENALNGIQLLKDCSAKTKDLILAQGELLSVKLVAKLLRKKNIKTEVIDSRTIIKTDSNFGNANVDLKSSKQLTKKALKPLNPNVVTLITGFIGSDSNHQTTTIGRDGSNYTASLIANFISATKIESYTHVDGIFTANPEEVGSATIIPQLHYNEANEIASFGASVLHAKTISPLITKRIPLEIKNTFKPNQNGTIINHNKTRIGVKSIAIQKDIDLINFEGRGILGKSGIDGRIFNVLKQHNISVGLISQGSSETGVSFIVNKDQTKKTLKYLKQEFEIDFKRKTVSSISAASHVALITVIGQSLNGFLKPYQSLVKNNVNIKLINNTLSGNNIGLLVDEQDVSKAANIIHSQIFGVSKTINVAIFGKGTVGSSLINQIAESRQSILDKKETNIHVFAVADSKKIWLNSKRIEKNWEKSFEKKAKNGYDIETVISYAQKHHLENLVAIDNTASDKFIANYFPLVENGFDLISSNKIANTKSYACYKKLKQTLKLNKKSYLYETNVGAGLPVIDTIKLLHDSGENITRIKGVFSGSLSYIFNTFSDQEQPFHQVLKTAIDNGFTEPDPREDLCGNDVARKLLILARELDLQNEFDDIHVQNLIPKPLRKVSKQGFFYQLQKLDNPFSQLKENQKSNHVLRYVGELHGNLQKEKGLLDVKLISVPKNSALGQLKGSDSIIEIYTESYGDKPIIIQGAGAGAEVTARGVFGDLLRIADKK